MNKKIFLMLTALCIAGTNNAYAAAAAGGDDHEGRGQRRIPAASGVGADEEQACNIAVLVTPGEICEYSGHFTIQPDAAMGAYWEMLAPEQQENLNKAAQVVNGMIIVGIDGENRYALAKKGGDSEESIARILGEVTDNKTDLEGKYGRFSESLTAIQNILKGIEEGDIDDHMGAVLAIANPE